MAFRVSGKGFASAGISLSRVIRFWLAADMAHEVCLHEIAEAAYEEQTDETHRHQRENPAVAVQERAVEKFLGDDCHRSITGRK